MAYLIIMLSLLSVKNFAQNTTHFPIKSCLLTLDGDTIQSSNLLIDKKPVLMLFWFAGCTGCKISLDQTLMVHYKDWEQKYGIKIIAVSVDKEANRAKAIELFKKYPFELYFDIDKSIFAEMPPTPYKGKEIKAFPSLIYINQDHHCQAVDAWDASGIEAVLIQDKLMY